MKYIVYYISYNKHCKSEDDWCQIHSPKFLMSLCHENNSFWVISGYILGPVAVKNSLITFCLNE